jgi:hypothetical protein
MDASPNQRLQPTTTAAAERRAALTLVIAKMLPNQNHPLTLAHIAGAKATTHSAMSEATRLIRALEKDATEQTIAACRVAAEILIERKQA